MAAMRREMFFRRAGIFRVCHTEQYAAVLAPLLTLQAFQHALVAEGFEVVAHAVEDIVHEGIAPVQRADEAPEDALRRVEIFEVQQLVQQHLVVRAAARQGEDGPDDTADEGRGQALDLDGAAAAQAVFFAHGGEARRDLRRGGRPAAKY